jgi:predicted permease
MKNRESIPARLSSLISRLCPTFTRRKRTQGDFAEELQSHLVLEADRLREAGMSEEEALAAARRNLGNMTQAQERFYEAHRWLWLDDLIQDLRYGLRQLRRNPGFAAVAVITLALGIGANTAIFSVVNAVLLRSMPVRKPGELVLLYARSGTGRHSGGPVVGRWNLVSYDAFQYFARNGRSFQGLAAFRSGTDAVEVRWPGVASHGQAERAVSHLVSGNYLDVMGVSSLSGRVLEPSDDAQSARPVAVISYDYWVRRLNRNPQTVGRSVDLNGTSFTIVGVAPPEFFGERMYDRPPDFWVPLTFQPQITQRKSYLTRQDEYWLNFIGRLKPGITLAQAQAALDVQLREFLVAQAGARPSKRDQEAIKQAYIELSPGGRGISHLRDQYSKPLHILLAIVALLLLVACANVANLLLSRSAARQKEISTRLVVGATRPRLVRQMLTESVLLAIFGAGAGLLLANWGVHVLSSLLSHELVLDVTADPAILAFTLSVALLTGLAFGLAPALQMSRTDLNEAVKAGTSRVGRPRSRLTSGLVVLQVAVSVTLLAAAGLLARSLSNLEDQDLGFNRNNVLLVQTDPRLAGVNESDLDSLYRQLLDRLNTLPGVKSATIAYYSPLSGESWHTGITVEAYTRHGTNINPVAPGYFATLGIPVILGRPIQPQDTAKSPPVAVVNQAFADRFFHGQDPVGRRFWIGNDKSAPSEEIIGLVGNARYHSPSESAQPFVFVPLSQMPDYFAGNIEIRTAGDAAAASAEIRRAIHEVDSDLPIVSVETLRRQIYDRQDQPRLVAELSILFGLFGLVLASVGLYGIISSSATRRTREIGIRMALGARKEDVLGMVIAQGLKLALIGVGVGIVCAAGVTRLLSSLLYGVKPTDALTFIGASILLAVAATLASYIPARRAAKVDPMVALRHE